MKFIEFINTSEHYNYVKSWLRARDMTPGHMPELGWMVFEDHTAIAAGFIRKCEGGEYALLDTLVTNPALPGPQRSDGIDTVVSTIITAAKQLKLKGLFATTVDKHTLERSKRFGFLVQPHALITLELKE